MRAPMAENEPEDLQLELEKLLELAVKYPEVGPPLAALAYKAGWRSYGDRLVRVGLTGGEKGLEYYAVAVSSARRDGRTDDARRLVLEAARDLSQVETVSEHGVAEFLRLVRQGFSSLLHDQKDPKADLAFPTALSELWPTLEAKLQADPLYHVIRAQLVWYAEPEAAEAAWAAAAEKGDAELVWNARGTWAKDAEKDEAAAERAYRAGLEKARGSALLLHNLAQLLMDRHAATPAEGEGGLSPKQRNRDLNEADALLRRALKSDSARGLRRFVHNTLDRLHEMHPPPPARPREARRTEAPEEAQRPTEPLPEVGAVVKGRVVGLTEFGVFVAIPGGHVGLVHRTELAHERVGDPAKLVNEGDEFDVKVLEVGTREGGKSRLGLSRKALLEAPPQAPRPPRPEHAGPRGDRPRGDRPRGDGPRGDRPRPGPDAGPRPPREGGEARPAGEGGENRPPREGGDNRPSGDRGPRPPREGGDNRPSGDRGPRPPREGGDNRPSGDRGPRPPRDGGDNRGPREGGQRPPRDGGDNRPPRRDDRPAASSAPSGDRFGSEGKLSLGEMLLAKLREQEAARKG